MSADMIWAMMWCAMVGGALGFFAACILTSRSIYEAYAEGYQEACDDVAEGRIFDGVRWKVADPENKPSSDPQLSTLNSQPTA